MLIVDFDRHAITPIILPVKWINHVGRCLIANISLFFRPFLAKSSKSCPANAIGPYCSLSNLWLQEIAQGRIYQAQLVHRSSRSFHVWACTMRHTADKEQAVAQQEIPSLPLPPQPSAYLPWRTRKRLPSSMMIRCLR